MRMNDNFTYYAMFEDPNLIPVLLCKQGLFRQCGVWLLQPEYVGWCGIVYLLPCEDNSLHVLWQVLRLDRDELQAKLTTLDKSGDSDSEDEDWMSDDEDQDEIGSGTVDIISELSGK